MAIPGRQINAELQTVLAGRGGNIMDEISLASFPGTGFDAIFSLRGRPQAEAVVMFGDEDNVFDPCGFGGLHPLLGICLSRIKDGRVRGAVSPLAVHEGVWTEVNDRADFQILPGDLLRTGL